MPSYNPSLLSDWFGLLRVRSPLLTESSLFLALLRCFSSRGSLACAYTRITGVGFPIRIPTAVAAVYASLSLFAVYRVLLRHEMPRHPLCPLIRFVRVIRRSGWFCMRSSSRRVHEPYSSRVFWFFFDVMSYSTVKVRAPKSLWVIDPCLKSTRVNRKNGAITRDEKSLTFRQAPSHNASDEELVPTYSVPPPLLLSNVASLFVFVNRV